jgi:hypothetical protein
MRKKTSTLVNHVIAWFNPTKSANRTSHCQPGLAVLDRALVDRSGRQAKQSAAPSCWSLELSSHFQGHDIA